MKIHLKENILSLFLYLLVNFSCFSQDKNAFIVNGNNLQTVNCSEIIFKATADSLQRTKGNGSAWYHSPIDLSKPLNISFIANYQSLLGFTKMVSNEGFSFVLQSAGTNSLGNPSAGIGFGNIKPSIALTVDRQQDAADNDPPFDHISLQINGDTKHASPNNLAGPVNIEQLYKFIPGSPSVTVLYSFLNIRWDPSSQLLEVYADSSLILSATYDLINHIFGGNPIVYWGFTGSNNFIPQGPAPDGMLYGSSRLYFGYIFPGYTTLPNLDTCFSAKPLQFFDDSKYDLTDLFNNVNTAKWYWDFGNGNISTLRNPPPQNYPGPGEYQFKFTVTNQIGCSVDTLTRIIKLGSKPVVDFSSGPICENNTAYFTDKSTVQVGNANGWTWKLDNNTVSRDQNAIVKLPGYGTKNMTLIVNTNLYCSDSIIKVITIGEQPKPEFTFTRDCDRNLRLTASAQNNITVSKWFWDLGDSEISSLQNPLHHYATNDTYSVKLHATSAEGCLSDSIQKNISIIKVIPFAGNDTVISAGQPLQLHGTGGSQYLWSPSTGLNDPHKADPVARLTTSQAYLLSVMSADGCEGKDSIYITVYKESDIYVPTAFTPNGDGKNDVFRVVAPGIKKLSYFRIFNRLGQLIFETTDLRKGWDGRLNGNPQGAGAYVWMIKAVDYKENTVIKKGSLVLVR